jgi:hypothetical protein
VSQFPSGLSSHGKTWLLDSNSEPHTRLREMVFEFVRRSSFPGKPSRFQSVFAFNTLDDAKAFCNFYAAPGSAIWEVTAVDSFRANMMLLDIRGPGWQRAPQHTTIGRARAARPRSSGSTS